MSFCLSKWAVIYAGSMRPFVWAIIPHVIIIILRRPLIVAISLARRSHPAGPGEDHSAKVVVATSDWGLAFHHGPRRAPSLPSRAWRDARSPETPLSAGDAQAVYYLFITCLLPVYSGSSGAEQLFKVVLQSTAEWVELGSSQRRQHITIRLLPWQRRA